MATSKAAAHRAKVQSLDSLGTDLDDFIVDNALTVYEQAIGNFIERVHKNINREKNMVTTGAINDISMKAEDGVINVYASPHLIYQSRGVNGAKKKLYDTPHSYKDKMPPVEVFKQWIKDKKIFLTPLNDKHREADTRLSMKERTEDRPFKELTEEQLINKAAWGMAKKVYNEGFKPRDLYEKEIPKLVEDLANALGDFSVQQISQQIDIKPREGGGKRIILPQK